MHTHARSTVGQAGSKFCHSYHTRAALVFASASLTPARTSLSEWYVALDAACHGSLCEKLVNPNTIRVTDTDDSICGPI